MYPILIMLLGVIFTSISMTFSKKLSTIHHDKSVTLIYQYISVIIFALILHIGFVVFNGQVFLPQLSLIQILWVIITSIIGYAGIYFLFRAFDKTATGVALIVAYLSTFIMYFVNIRLIDSSEIISVEKIILAIAFFVVVAGLLFIKDKNNKKKLALNVGILFAIGTALCWSFYFSANTYFIKTNWMSPSQSLLLTESGVAIAAIIFYIYKYRLRSKTELIKSYRMHYLPWIVGVGLFLMASVLCKYYGYKYLPSALVNVARLFSIAMTTFFCRWWYGEKLQKKEILFIVIAFILLILFLIV